MPRFSPTIRPEDRLALRVNEASIVAGISRSTIYKLMASKKHRRDQACLRKVACPAHGGAWVSLALGALFGPQAPLFWQWYAQVARSKQAMASDPWANVLDFNERSYGLPPGFEPVDDKDYPPPVRQTTARRLIDAGASGINAGIAGMLGLPVDIANTVLRGVGFPVVQAPVMGSAWLRDLERRCGIVPDLADRATTAEKVAHAGGYGAAATMLPATILGL